MPRVVRALALGAALTLAGCGDEPAAEPEAPVKETPRKAAEPEPTLAPQVEGDVTPNEERIATLGLLNKRNNLTQDLVLKVGETRRFGNVMVKLASCERTAPWEVPEETGAFVQVFTLERPAPRAEQEWRRAFSGWLFANSPALNVVEHPIYDVWVKDCAMNFPGEEAQPADSPATKS